MGLEDDLKARTSALISQQMANWVVEIQRAIQGHQAALVSALDELGETVARYDEKVDESSIASAMSEVIAQQPPAAGADYGTLKASIAAIEKGTNLTEVLTQLMNEVQRNAERSAMFIVKNNAAVGWNARGFDHGEAVKAVTIPLTGDTVFRLVHGTRNPTRGHATQSPGTAQALARLGGGAQGIMAVPLVLRDKVAAILYCDSTQDDVPAATADVVEIMVAFAAKSDRRAERRAPKAGGAWPHGPRRRQRRSSRPPIPASGVDRLGGAGTCARLPRLPCGPRRPAPAPRAPPPASAPPARPSTCRRCGPPSRAPPPPVWRPRRRVGTVGRGPEGARGRQALRAPGGERDQALQRGQGHRGPQDQGHLQRLEGRHRARTPDVQRSRARPGARHTDYFQDELVRILAGGDAGALGSN